MLTGQEHSIIDRSLKIDKSIAKILCQQLVIDNISIEYTCILHAKQIKLNRILHTYLYYLECTSVALSACIASNYVPIGICSIVYMLLVTERAKSSNQMETQKLADNFLFTGCIMSSVNVNVLPFSSLVSKFSLVKFLD